MTATLGDAQGELAVGSVAVVTSTRKRGHAQIDAGLVVEDRVRETFGRRVAPQGAEHRGELEQVAVAHGEACDLHYAHCPEPLPADNLPHRVTTSARIRLPRPTARQKNALRDDLDTPSG